MKLQIICHSTRTYYYSESVPNSVREMSIQRSGYHLKETYLNGLGYTKRDDRLMIQMGKLNQLQ